MIKNILLLSLFLFAQSVVSKESSELTLDKKTEAENPQDVSILKADATDSRTDGPIVWTPDFFTGYTPNLDLSEFTRKTNKGTPYNAR